MFHTTPEPEGGSYLLVLLSHFLNTSATQVLVCYQYEDEDNDI